MHTDDNTQGIRIAVTTAMRGLSAQDLETFPEVSLVLSQGVGLEKLDLVAATAHGVVVSVTPNILTEDVADFAIGLTYAITRRIAEADRFVRAGRWGGERIRPSTSVHKKRMGVVGMGRIGQAIARRAAGLGMEVCYFSRIRNTALPYDYAASPQDLAKVSDVLVLACPGGPATENLCDRSVLDALGPQGFLINIARGSVVDEVALLAALEGDEIAGAGLDVFATEPALNARFIALDNVVLTPHSASVTQEVRAELICNMLSEAHNFIAGRPLKNVANPAD
ncbi:NAD(P)-binding domain-containing protein [Sulfitobacter sp. F26204]|uniref:NAD(P)-dependent oxidoreductase n=1 Tax=Sulfitobacter sp. F26204 TaxID=2996014 RepID=UPI00225DFCA6|nr:NAD(P)-dependent oxidoreductase [Sulfitobacter sp. F26204]MCX7561359.1 NAD(P)-binding domain-containing protein [Sulfitobacter sp. F26204]